ncbi:hypothetical protein [Coleofasciculus sp. G2-EDA-02]|uniref:hypothetical protein n=1 Tax=Coleofasciculus sp. G2-EDA-02 TaxID=3069529 RepID=UPI0032F4FA51
MTTEGKVLAILLMQFNLPPVPALKVVDSWLREHPQENWDTLKELLKRKIITMVNGKLTMVIQGSNFNQDNVVTHYHRGQSIRYSQPRQPQPPLVQTYRFRGVTYHKVEAPPIQNFTTINQTIPSEVSRANPNDDIPTSDSQVVNFNEYAERKKRSQENQLNHRERSGT